MLKTTLILVLLLLVTVFYAGPFFWMVSTSLKTTTEAGRDKPILVPWDYTPPVAAGRAAPTTGPDATRELTDRAIDPSLPALEKRYLIARYNYQKVLTDPSFDFILYARNTLLIAIASVIGSVLSSSLVAYSLAKLQWHGRNLLFGVVLSTMMLPFTVFMVPHYIIYKHLHLIGTNVPLWLGSFFGIPFFIFLLRQFYLTIPNELLDAARIDGCSELRIWWQIILPLSRPALAVVAVFAFLGAWNDFLGPLVYLVHKPQFTLSLALQFFQSKSGGTPWELLMAASIIVIAPVIALFFMAQKTFIQGIATTGMKG